MVVAKKQSRGRQRIEIKRITNDAARDVCFSKRRAGVFKKACELSILSGSDVGVVVFSPAGRAFSFGHPSVYSVAGCLFAGDNEPLSLAHGNSSGSRRNGDKSTVEDLSRMCTELQALTEAAKKRSDDLKKELEAKQETDPSWWTADIWDMGLEDMVEFERMLKCLKCELAAQRRTEQLLAESYIQKPFSGVVANVYGGGVAFAHANFVVKNDDVKLAPLPSFIGLDYGYNAIYANFD